MLEFDNYKYSTNDFIIFTQSLSSNKFPFYLISFGYVVAKDGFFTKRTQRNDYYFIFTLSGSGKLTWHNNTVDLLPYSACLINCVDFQHYWTTSKDVPWIHYYVHFNGTGMEAYQPFLLDKLRVFYSTHIEIFLDGFKWIQKNKLRNDPLASSKASHMISSFLNELMSIRYNFSDHKISKFHTELIPAYDYIKLHYKEQINIHDLCESCHLSKYYFIHLFKQIVGESPYQYIINYRINAAKQLLLNSNDSVEEISHAVGFPNYTNFLVQFKKNTELTPNCFRKSMGTHHVPFAN